MPKKQQMKNTMAGLKSLNLSEKPVEASGNNDAKVRELQDRIRELESEQSSGENHTEEIADLRHQISQSIVQVNDSRWQFGRFQLTLTNLKPPEDLTDDEFDALGLALSGMSGAINFWLGDWANLIIDAEERHKQAEINSSDVSLSEDERGEIYKSLVEKFGLESIRTLQQYASVCRLIPPAIRIEGVHWSNHQLVAFLPAELKGQEEHFLNLAFSDNLSTNKLREKIKEARAKLLPEKIPPVFDSKSIIVRFRKLSKLMMLSDDAEIKLKKKQDYLDDIFAIERVLDEMKKKLED